MDKLSITDFTTEFIGLGLIGGSIAKGIEHSQPDIKIMACMRPRSRLEQAKREGTVDVVLDGIGEHLRECGLIFLYTPVGYNAGYLPAIRPFLKQGALITDVGSTKQGIHQEIIHQELTHCFVGGHPMAGSEKTGYENSTNHLLGNAYYIVTPPRDCDSSGSTSLSENDRRIIAIAHTIRAIPLVLDHREHDEVVAAISHPPHLVAFGLVDLIEDNDTSNGIVGQVAAGGSRDITRVASSSPEIWEQVCIANVDPIAGILEKCITSLNQVLDQIKHHGGQSVYQLLKTSRDYHSSIMGKAKGSVEPSYEFAVDMADEIGVISTISVILAAKDIGIENIDINSNRERGEGALKIAFYDEASIEAAWQKPDQYKYEMFRMQSFERTWYLFMEFTKSHGLHGEITVPDDKSISHRAMTFDSIAKGLTEIHSFLQGADCFSTIACFEKMGVSIENRGDRVLIQGNGLHGLKKPDCVLNYDNSGTITRLISGILCAQDFTVALTEDESVQKRPMKHIVDPLSLMGAGVTGLQGNDCAPLLIKGGPVHGIRYPSKMASAQVKSAIPLTGLYADSPVSVTEPCVPRNHSEVMLGLFGAQVSAEDTTATTQPASRLNGAKIMVPGGTSSAAYFIATGLMVPGSQVLVRSVEINPTRDGILRVCQDMEADLQLLGRNEGAGEPTTDILVHWDVLHGTEIDGAIIPTLIDELPIIAAMACLAKGRTVIRDAAELKVKESNRITIMMENLRSMGADVAEAEDGMIIQGGRPLHGAFIDSHGDHRIAITFAVTALRADRVTNIRRADCVTTSYPRFYGDLQGLMV